MGYLKHATEASTEKLPQDLRNGFIPDFGEGMNGEHRKGIRWGACDETEGALQGVVGDGGFCIYSHPGAVPKLAYQCRISPSNSVLICGIP